MTNHQWPAILTDHIFGPWYIKDKKTKYRTCIHPNCNAVEEMDVSKF